MLRRLALALALALSIAAAACGGDDGNPGAPDADLGADAADLARPYGTVIPPGYVPGTPAPLVVVLHGYGASGAVQSAYFGLTTLAEETGFLLALPDGTLDGNDSRFWNATDACCDFGSTGVDDVAYLTSVIDDMAARYTVDADRVFLVGHSNGGFMSNRMACDVADRVAGIASLAGSTWSDPALCSPSRAVNVLLIHGDADDTILYPGGSLFGAMYPGAQATAQAWATENGCTGAPVAGASIDIEAGLAGAETTVAATAGCPTGGDVELWSIVGGSHIPNLAGSFAQQVWDWLAARGR